MYEVMMNMGTWILYKFMYWNYDANEDRNCTKNMYEVMKNMKTGMVGRICMKL